MRIRPPDPRRLAALQHAADHPVQYFATRAGVGALVGAAFGVGINMLSDPFQRLDGWEAHLQPLLDLVGSDAYSVIRAAAAFALLGMLGAMRSYPIVLAGVARARHAANAERPVSIEHPAEHA